VEGRQPARPPILLAPLAFVGLGTLAAVLGLTIRRQRWLLADGRPAVAVVTSTRCISAGHALSHRTTLEFQTLSGARATARLDLQKRAPVGSELVVLYDAESPARCRPYPLSLVRLARL